MQARPVPDPTASAGSFFHAGIILGFVSAVAGTAHAQTVLTEQAKLQASDAADLDVLGASVSVFGDTAIFGAPLDDHAGGMDSGSAYVFVRSGRSWTEQAKLVASDAAANDLFGWSVAISGDTAVVGAQYDNHAGGTLAGSAYVFVRSGTIWSQQAKLVASDAADSSFFGISASIFGDTAVVGALNLSGGAATGSAYVFVRSGTSWTEQAKLLASDAANGDDFGVSVSIFGDAAVVGASLHDHGLVTDAGSAYVFVRSGTHWSEQAKLVANNAGFLDSFGISVSISGETAVIGAYLDDDAGGTDAGSAYVFVRNGTSWTEQAKLLASDAEAGEYFGQSVSISGDTAVVGAIFDDHAGVSSAGSAYLFVRSGTSWTQQAKLVASDAAGFDNFGSPVSISGDTAMAGVGLDDYAGYNAAGSVYVYCLVRATATSRNAGSNPASFTCNVPIVGGTWTATVELSTTGHLLAVLYAFDSPFQFTFSGGQVLLCFDLGGAGELLGMPSTTGPTAVFNLAVPSDLTLCGLSICTQALHVGLVTPFALSNAEDVTIGTF